METGRQTHESDFIGHYLTSVELPIKAKTKIYYYIEVTTILLENCFKVLLWQGYGKEQNLERSVLELHFLFQRKKNSLPFKENANFCETFKHYP